MINTNAAIKEVIGRAKLTPSILAIIAFCITFTLQAQLIHNFSVNIPFWDEWEDFPAIQAAYSDRSLTWQQIFAPHNEHRPAVPRLITLGLFGILDEWSPVAAMFVSAILVSFTAAIWAYTIRHIGANGWATCLSALLLASPVQYQNITWGFQTCFYVLTLSLTMGVCKITLTSSVRWRDVLIAMLAASCATFSLAAGLLLWPVFGLCMVIKASLLSQSLWALLRERGFALKLLLYTIAGCCEALFYVQGVTFSHSQQSLLERVVRVFLWSAMALGYPLVDSIHTNSILLILAALIMYLPISITLWYYIKIYTHKEASSVIVLLGGFITLPLG